MPPTALPRPVATAATEQAPAAAASAANALAMSVTKAVGPPGSVGVLIVAGGRAAA